jgi:hypothetical protein
MKVNVITVEDVKIGRWSWFSKWIDVAVFDYRFRSFLLQMRISRTNAKSFRVVSMTGNLLADAKDIGDLTQMRG